MTTSNTTKLLVILRKLAAVLEGLQAQSEVQDILSKITTANEYFESDLTTIRKIFTKLQTLTFVPSEILAIKNLEQLAQLRQSARAVSHVLLLQEEFNELFP